MLTFTSLGGVGWGGVDVNVRLAAAYAPGSLSSGNPMMTDCKAWKWRFIHRNADVCDITAKTLRKLK